MAEYMRTGETLAGARDEEHASFAHRAVLALSWEHVALAAVTCISVILEFFRLNREGYANTYYAAAVKSMMQSWHNFFFVSFDPGGFVSVDKPPVALWIQVLSAKLFGFSGVSILLPQALAAILSVVLLYVLIQRVWGRVPGLIAALALAVMPVSVATGRNNTMDSVLVLVVLLAAWTSMKAAETGRLRWLLLTAVLVGIGFNIKMLEAYLVLPALGLLYLVAAPRRWSIRLVHLVAATVVLLIVSFSWATAVDLTPASQRPYVGSSSNNTELNLILGYNGLNRFQQGLYGAGNSLGGPGNFAGRFGGRRPPGTPFARTGQNANPAVNGWFFGTGQPGPTRLFSQALAGQIGWLLPLAFLGLLLGAWQTRRRWPLDRRQQSLVLWGMWLLTQVVYFSIASRFQSYYLVMLAPGIAALSGIGVVALWREYRQAPRLWWLLPLALLGLALYQASILSSFTDWSARLDPMIIGLCIVAAIGLVVAHRWTRAGVRFTALAATVGVFALVAAPAVWAAIPAWNGSSSRPVAGPGAETRGRRIDDGIQTDSKLLSFLQTHEGKTRFLFAAPSAMEAAPYILATGKPIMALGGFSGRDFILTPAGLATLVHQGTVRYFLLPGQRSTRSLAAFFLNQGGAGHGSHASRGHQIGASSVGSGGEYPYRLEGSSGRGGVAFWGGGQRSPMTQWVTQHCSAMKPSLWQSGSVSAVHGRGAYGSSAAGAGQHLYDCGNAR
ncbi:MAG: glycosyltransferase family 39 protein [Chloroflexota bacterium]